MTDTTKASVALVLQGGGALGAYQAGAISRLADEGVHPHHVAGISIGAINSAIVAGNPPDRRAERLAAFWHRVSSTIALPGFSAFGPGISMMFGAPGFFSPRFPPASMAGGEPARAGIYDTRPLRATLEELVDFDLLNDGPVRCVVGAVDVATGNFVWFDTAQQRLGPEHIMASGALPPGFAPIEIGGRFYWDGGLVSNTPLSRVIETRTCKRPQVIWQIDLFPARGDVPVSVWQVDAREKDIRYSSRTRAVSDRMVHDHSLADALHTYRDALPVGLLQHPVISALLQSPPPAPLTLVHLIYQSNAREAGAKDFDFSRDAMVSHWSAGIADVAHSLSHPDYVSHNIDQPGIHVFDAKSGEGKTK